MKRGVVLPARPNNGCRRLSINGTRLSFFSSWPRLTRQKSRLATLLGEACGVDDSLAVGLGACLLELFPAFTKSLADMDWHAHFETACKL